nr:MAG TPA: hypothetical protein [Caudoviricetes sp.]
MPETDTHGASPHALPIAPTMANVARCHPEPFFGALDGLSRRTLVLLPSSAERLSDAPLFESTPPAAAAMAGAHGVPKARATPHFD